jgi:hypothetical protein
LGASPLQAQPGPARHVAVQEMQLSPHAQPEVHTRQQPEGGPVSSPQLAMSKEITTSGTFTIETPSLGAHRTATAGR